MSVPAGEVRPTAGQVRLRYWAAARAAAGVGLDVIDVTGPVSLATLRTLAKELHATSRRFSDVLDTCSVLVGDLPAASIDPAEVQVVAGQTVEFLPPFAGG
jgi:molybdopterin synthase sulfur carrier subunit